MKTLRNILLTLVLATCATASLTAMEKTSLSGFNSNNRDYVIQGVAQILSESTQNPICVLICIQNLYAQYGSDICLVVLNTSLILARTKLSSIKNERGNTVLHLACAGLSPHEIIQIICKAVATTESSAGILFTHNKHGELAYDLAQQNDRLDIASYMLNFANEYGLRDQLLDRAAPKESKLRTEKENDKQTLALQPKQQDNTTESFEMGFGK